MLLITQPRAGRLHNESLALQTMARQMNWDVFNTEFGWRLPEEIIKSNDVGVPYGSQTFCEVIAQQMNWQLLQNSFDWLTLFPREYLKREVRFCLMKNARNLSFNKPMFIKPADYKLFPAKVYEPGGFNPPPDLVAPDDTPILISEPVEFIEEYRCFVEPLRCKTVSCYLYHGEINEPKNWNNNNCENAKAFVESALSALSFLGTKTIPSVVDVGIIKDKGWAIIENNQAWASGIYGCEPYDVLNVLKYTCNRSL